MKLLSFGEVLWDIVDSQEYLGGAPFNLAAHAGRCGGDCAMISSLGKDSRGQTALAAAKKMQIDCRYVRIDENHPTGTVDAVISATGQPDYIIHEPVAYDFIDLDDDTIREIAQSRFDVFCFGTLAQRSKVSRDSLMRLLAGLRGSGTRIFCDVNLRQNYYNKDILETSLEACDILKLNDEEVGILSQLLFDVPGMDIQDFCRKLARQMDIKDIVVTMGEKGAMVFDGGGCQAIDGHKVEVADTIGAGDAFSAVFLCKKLNGCTSRQATAAANRVGAFVASKSGAIPEYDAKIMQFLSE